MSLPVTSLSLQLQIHASCLLSEKGSEPFKYIFFANRHHIKCVRGQLWRDCRKKGVCFLVAVSPVDRLLGFTSGFPRAQILKRRPLLQCQAPAGHTGQKLPCCIPWTVLWCNASEAPSCEQFSLASQRDFQQVPPEVAPQQLWCSLRKVVDLTPGRPR